MHQEQRKKKLPPLKGAWEFQGLGEDPKNPVPGEMKAIFEHVARLDGKPVPSVRLKDPHIIAYTKEEAADHFKNPGMSPIAPRLLIQAAKAFDYLFPEKIITIEDEAPCPRAPRARHPYRRNF